MIRSATCWLLDWTHDRSRNAAAALHLVLCRVLDQHDPWCRGRRDHTWSPTKKRTIRQPKGHVAP